MIVADRDEHVGLRLGELCLHQRDALENFFRAGRTRRLLEEPRHEGVVRDADDGNNLSHADSRQAAEKGPSTSLRSPDSLRRTAKSTPRSSIVARLVSGTFLLGLETYLSCD